MNATMEPAGFLITEAVAMTVLAVWMAVVLGHGLIRSRGDAPQDPIRPSGPAGVLDPDGD